MAQFIQSNQLSPIKGGIGNQQMIQQNRDPLPGLVDNIGSIYDMAGDIYSQDKAQSIVNSEIENIDSAVAAAEKRAEAPAMIAEDDVPASVKMDQKEWDILSNAVRSGTMSRERARLLASSRVRTRIAEQPLFADRMRKAASGVLGFNIESESARQYFAHFPTEGEMGGGANKYRQDKLQQAQVISEALDVSPDAAYKQLVQADYASEQKRAAKAQFELGTISAQDYTSEMELADGKQAFGTLLGEIRAFERQEGKPVDGVAMQRIVDERKQAYIEEFNSGWVESGGQLNTPDHTRALGNINKRYGDYKEFVESVGMDNLNAIQIERAEQMRTMMGDKFFPQMKLITDTFGQQVTSDIISMFSLNETQRDLVLSQNPELNRAFNMMNQDPKQFTQRMSTTATKIMNGDELSEEDAPFVNHVSKSLHDQGGQETKKSIIQGLASANANFKALSLLAETSPRLEPDENIAYFKEMYDNGLAPTLNGFAKELAANPRLDWSVENDGTLTVSQDSAAGALPTPGPGGLMTNPQDVQQDIVNFNRAQQLADKVNQFAKGHKKGWSRVVGENLDEYKAKVNRLVQQYQDDETVRYSSENINEIVGLVESGNYSEAQTRYESLRSKFPQEYPQPWEEVLSEARRQAGDK